MPKTWQLHEAKNKFSRVVEKAISEGPRGVPAVVLISWKDLERLRKPKATLVQFLAGSPLKRLRLDLERDKEPGRTLAPP